MRWVLLGAMLVLGCEGEEDDSTMTVKKRLYQTGCGSNADCQDNGVCKTEGSMTVCLPPCSGGACTDSTGRAGQCESGACVLTCTGACPEMLACVSGRCVPPTGAEVCPLSCGANLICYAPSDSPICAPICGRADPCTGTCVDVPGSAGMQACTIPCEATPATCPMVSDGQAASACTAGLCDYRAAF